MYWYMDPQGTGISNSLCLAYQSAEYSFGVEGAGIPSRTLNPIPK